MVKITCSNKSFFFQNTLSSAEELLVPEQRNVMLLPCSAIVECGSSNKIGRPDNAVQMRASLDISIKFCPFNPSGYPQITETDWWNSAYDNHPGNHAI